jgi:ATPase subunit of ABC transporter with duplicated ATPase domains
MKTISLKNISQSFMEKVILDAVSFKVTDQERMCIVGDNGTGKSTLLKIIVGTLEPVSGMVENNAHTRCYYIPQEFHTDDLALTVEGFMLKYGSVSLYRKILGKGAGERMQLPVGWPAKNFNAQCRHCHGAGLLVA